MHEDKNAVIVDEALDELPFRRLRATDKSSKQAATLLLDTEWLEVRSRIEQHSLQVVRDLIDKKAKIIAEEVHNSKSIVFIVRMQQNQQKDLNQLIERVRHNIERVRGEKRQSEEEVAPETEVELFDPSNIRAMFLRLEELNAEHAALPTSDRKKRRVNVLVTARIVSFSEVNLRQLDRMYHMMRDRPLTKHTQFRLVVATHHDLSNFNILRLKINVSYLELYNPKAIFCRFLLRVLCDEELKLYLPAEALQLVRQFDDYPQVYQEAVRRVIYLANVLHNQRVNFKPVKISNLVSGLTKAMIRADELSEEQEAKLYERLIFAIIDANEQFRIPAVFVESYIEGEFNTNIDAVAVRLLQEFRKHPDTAKLVNSSHPIGKLQALTTYLKGHKNDRVSQMQIPKSVEGKEVMLGRQLNSLIKSITADIRKQAKTVPWSKFKLEDRIWPDTTKIILEDAEKSDLNKLLPYTSQCIERRHKETLADSGLENKQYAFYISVLDYMGLVEFTKKQIEPTYYNQIFGRARLRK